MLDAGVQADQRWIWALGREFGKPVILSTQGSSDLGELGPQALDQAAQDAAWLLPSVRARGTER